jgi:hypothetical protein
MNRPVHHRTTVLPFAPLLLFALAMQASADAVVLRNDVCRYEIDSHGLNRALVDLASGTDHCAPGQPFMVLGRGARTWPSSRVELTGEVLSVSFGDSAVQVKAQVGVHPRYFTLSIADVSGGAADWLQLCNLRVKLDKNVGTLVNAAWDDRFAVCVLACNDRTDGGSHGVLSARAYREFGINGAKVAIVAVPTGPPDPPARLLDAIETVELEQGLPHPLKNGVWIKRAPERFRSYLMVGGINHRNVDKVIELARGGFGCVELMWWRSTPTYEPDPSQFPGGLAGLKAVADKIHAAGMQVGLHVMQGMVGWGSKDDPYLTPKADPRLLQDRHATLAAPLEAKATEIAVSEPASDWPETGDLLLDGEVIHYAGRTARGFTRCQRGLYKTTVSNHPAGASVGHLVNCFPIWGFTVYSPDVNSTLIDEICARIVRVFDATGADMSYFDGGEELLPQAPQWRNQGRFALGVQRRLKNPVIIEGNALYTHLSWHVITRGSPDFDPIYFGRRAYTLRFKGQNPAKWAPNLLTGDVGWFAPHTHSTTTDAVTPDEVMLLCLKALGGKAPISFSVDANHLDDNKRMPEMRDIIRTTDELKRTNYFTETACAELTRPMAEHVLDRAGDGGWDLRPLQFGPPRVADTSRPGCSEWSLSNPYGEQTPWVRIRAQTRLAPFGAKGNVVLADFAGAVPFRVDGTMSPDLLQSVEPATETAPDGSHTFRYRAENRGKSVSGWSRLTLALPRTYDLTRHRRLGLWIRSEGQGGILNVQLAGKDARRDHYITLDREGWAYHVLDPPEDSRFYDHQWPYSFTDLMYTCATLYSGVTHLNLYFNALPPGSKTSCCIGRIEALEEQPQPLVSPTLTIGGQTLTFPATLRPDEYLEMDFSGRCRHFDPDGALLGEVVPRGALRVSLGEQAVRFTSAGGETTSSRAEVTIALRGAPLPGARRHGADPGTAAIAPARGR